VTHRARDPKQLDCRRPVSSIEFTFGHVRDVIPSRSQ
jgi:hypothetical protein